MKRLFLAATLIPLATIATAQTLTPEEISALVDKRMKELNPYQNLLNDPDPDRSLAAMQIMMESGDPDLTRMALEFGLLSPNPSVKRIAFEAWLSTGPSCHSGSMAPTSKTKLFQEGYGVVGMVHLMTVLAIGEFKWDNELKSLAAMRIPTNRTVVS